MSVRKDRSKQLHLLSDRKKKQFYHAHLGATHTVLFEQEEDEGKMYGFTENYIKVELPYQSEYVNQLVAVRLASLTLDQTVKVTIEKTVNHE
jgi:threonylcarbamoyladenosine tRNA methylthiotransferase MtaB